MRKPIQVAMHINAANHLEILVLADDGKMFMMRPDDPKMSPAHWFKVPDIPQE